MDVTVNGDAAPSMETMSAQDMDAYLGEYEAPKRGDIRTGVIIEQNETGLVVDVGLKQEGLVPASDLDRLEDGAKESVAAGAEVTVMVVRTSGREGHPILSISQARMQQDWINAEEMMKNDELLELEIIGSNRGGLIVPFGKLRGFVPASHVSGMPRRLSPQQRRERLDGMVGQSIGLKVIEVDRHRRRLILSQRRALRAWQEQQRDRVIQELTEGETRTGQVTSLTDFGAFVDLGGADGLIHVSELSWVRVDHPRDVLKVGDEVEVYVLNIDRKRKRIGLSLKRLKPDPWSLVEEHYQPGDLAEGRVTRVLDFGAFIELDLGVEGLLHPTEMIGTPELAPDDILEPGETVLVKILHTDARRRRIALSTSRVRRDEWERWEAQRQAEREPDEGEVGQARQSEEAGAAEEEPAAEPPPEEAGAAEEESAAEPPPEEAGAAEEESAAEPPPEEAAAAAAAAETEAAEEDSESAAEETPAADAEPAAEPEATEEDSESAAEETPAAGAEPAPAGAAEQSEESAPPEAGPEQEAAPEGQGEPGTEEQVEEPAEAGGTEEAAQTDALGEAEPDSQASSEGEETAKPE
jgi:small subunit ribosomal protein S1